MTLRDSSKSTYLVDRWLMEFWNGSSAKMDEDRQNRILRTIQCRLSAIEGAYRVPSMTLKPILYYVGRCAVILMLMCLTGAGVYFYLSEKEVPADLIITVNKGQKTNITLSDGSVVWVNSESKLSYGSHFNARERVVKLDGEAYFEVAHDKSRPFLVEANGMQINVHGTKFNVNTKREKMSVSLISGSVSLLYKNKEGFMKPGEIAYCSATSDSMEILKKDTRFAALWTRDCLQFKEQSLKEIAPILSEWYGVEILPDPSLPNREAYTFTLRNESLEEVLKMMSMINPITYKYGTKDQIRILPKKNLK